MIVKTPHPSQIRDLGSRALSFPHLHTHVQHLHTHVQHLHTLASQW
ncbi:MAG: hypothetical protein V3U43_09750 [Pseudomonadales bacterium]